MSFDAIVDVIYLFMDVIVIGWTYYN